jgi:hypothetical protein
MSGRRTLAAISAISLVAAFLAAPSGAGAAARLPTPGTAAQVAALVAASSSIKQLPSNLVPALSQVAADTPGTYYGVAGRECDGLTKCDFGDTKSKELLVLFGDSHAQMWLPALVPIATEEHVKLALVWDPGCPAADVTVWSVTTHSVNKGCNPFRTKMIKQIKKADPFLVLLADRTSDVPGANNKLIADSVWQAGLETTISEVKSTTTKVAVIGDIDAFDASEVIAECLASNSNNVQACSVANPNPTTHEHVAAEMAAASAEHVAYLNPQPWLCTTVCSPVIGNMVAYWDAFHVSSTYAEYLSSVWKSLLTSDKLLPPPT